MANTFRRRQSGRRDVAEVTFGKWPWEALLARLIDLLPNREGTLILLTYVRCTSAQLLVQLSCAYLAELQIIGRDFTGKHFLNEIKEMITRI